jgi:hypothetical protein
MGVKNKIKKIMSHLFSKSVDYEKIQFETTQRDNDENKVIFLLPCVKKPRGGNIVVHDHSDKIIELAYKKFTSEVMYPSNLSFRPDFFMHKSAIKSDNKFDINKDFVIVPEVMAARYAQKLYSLGVRYAIHVQNGYSMDLEVRLSNHIDRACLDLAYENASLIIGNSEDTLKNILFAFPKYADKLVRSYFVIDKHKNKPVDQKKNIITYMPRKLSDHSMRVLFFLENKLPDHWEIKAIDGVTEQEVYDIFFESKIFLSFSSFEGLAMPPAMAAMCGNHVIGYTGEANKEYFHLSCFDEIECGDVKAFARKVLDCIEKFETGDYHLNYDAIKKLEILFSKTNQKTFLLELLDRVDSVLTD